MNLLTDDVKLLVIQLPKEIIQMDLMKIVMLGRYLEIKI